MILLIKSYKITRLNITRFKNKLYIPPSNVVKNDVKIDPKIRVFDASLISTYPIVLKCRVKREVTACRPPPRNEKRKEKKEKKEKKKKTEKK